MALALHNPFGGTATLPGCVLYQLLYTSHILRLRFHSLVMLP